MQSYRQLVIRCPLSTWNSMIQASVRDGLFLESLNLYSSMLRAGFHGDNFTFPSIAKACAKLSSVWDGRKVHAHSILVGFEGDMFVQTSLMGMYSECSCLDDSRQLFDEMPVRNLVSWNSMISAYSKDNQINRSFELLGKMGILGLKPNPSTFVGLLSGYTRPGWVFWQGLSLHCYGIKLRFDSDLRFSNSLMSMYVRYGLVEAAFSLFESMEEKSTISLTTIIGGYAKMGDYMKVFNLFNQMRREKFDLDSISFVNLVSACALSGSLLAACCVHALTIKSGCNRKNLVSNSLVNVYTKCSDLKSAERIFDSMFEKNVVSWTSMIGGYVRNGCASKALSLFQKLLSTSIRPSEVTVTTILSACANLGSLDLGQKVEEYVKANGFESNLRVQTSLIHMYCRCGSIEMAKGIFHSASIKDLALWSSMVNGYAMHGMGTEALALFKEMLGQGKIKPDAVVFTGVLSACSHSGMVEEGLKLFDSMQNDFGVHPRTEHYLCLVDMLGRAGHLDMASDVIRQMPVHVQPRVWAPLLGACRNHLNGLHLAEFVLGKLPYLQPRSPGNYVLMAHTYASLGKWRDATEIRRLMDERGLVKEPGWSRIES